MFHWKRLALGSGSLWEYLAVRWWCLPEECQVPYWMHWRSCFHQTASHSKLQAQELNSLKRINSRLNLWRPRNRTLSWRKQKPCTYKPLNWCFLPGMKPREIFVPIFSFLLGTSGKYLVLDLYLLLRWLQQQQLWASWDILPSASAVGWCASSQCTHQ